MLFALVVVLLVAGFRSSRPAARLSPTPTENILEILRAKAEAELAAHDWPAATATLSELVAIDVADAGACYHLALLLLSYEPQTARDYLVCAAADSSLAAPAGALRRELDALTGEPDRAYANMRLGLALMRQDAWDMAGLALERALLLNPRYAEAKAYLGLVRAHQGDEDSVALARDAVEMAPESALVRYVLGRIYVLREDYSAAVPTLMQAAALDPSNAMTAAELGMAYRHRDDFESAERWLRRAAELARDDVFFWEHLAAFYADTGYKLDAEGLTAINSAALRMPESASIRASLGWALFNAGELKAACEELEIALTLGPDDPRVLYYYGVVLEQSGDIAGALDAYRRAAAPDGVFAGRAASALNRLDG